MPLTERQPPNTPLLDRLTDVTPGTAATRSVTRRYSSGNSATA